MENDYMCYPATIKAFAEEIKKVCDDYNARKISNSRIAEVIEWYANNQADKFFAADDINPTVSKIIGKKRLRLINDILEAQQNQNFEGIDE